MRILPLLSIQSDDDQPLRHDHGLPRSPGGAPPVDRARKIQRFLSQPFFVAEVFTGMPGIFVPIEETIESFEMLCNGELDHLPEQAFLNVGNAESAMAKARELEQS